MDIHNFSRRHFLSTMSWAFLSSAVVVGIAASLGRAAINLQGAVTEKPDIAIYLLLPEERISKVTLLRETDDERHYLAETKDGKKIVILKKGEEKWYVADVEQLHE